MEQTTYERRYRVAKLLLAIIAIIVAGLTAVYLVQAITAPSVETDRLITVTGTGQAESAPTEAVFGFQVEGSAETLEAAQSDVAARANTVIEYLESAGIDREDITTNQVRSNPRYDYREPVPFAGGESRVLVGYDAYQQFSVTVTPPDRAGELIAGVSSRGASGITDLQFKQADEDVEELERSARQDAIADAKKEAELLANQLGVKLGKVIRYDEGGGSSLMQGRELSADMAFDESTKTIPDLPIGTTREQVTVTITYSIK